MTNPRPVTRLTWLVLMVASMSCALPTSARPQESPSRQVVMFGVLATPGSTEMDPKISPIVAARLRKALPSHGFKLIKIKSDRLTALQSLSLDLGGEFVTSAQLTNPADPNGKVQLKFDLSFQGVSQFQSFVVTPPDQFNFFDKMLPNNNHILIGVGAR